jgi:hypothetical protein
MANGTGAAGSAPPSKYRLCMTVKYFDQNPPTPDEKCPVPPPPPPPQTPTDPNVRKAFAALRGAVNGAGAALLTIGAGMAFGPIGVGAVAATFLIQAALQSDKIAKLAQTFPNLNPDQQQEILIEAAANFAAFGFVNGSSLARSLSAAADASETLTQTSTIAQDASSDFSAIENEIKAQPADGLGQGAGSPGGWGTRGGVPQSSDPELELIQKYANQELIGRQSRLAASGMTPQQAAQVEQNVLNRLQGVNPYGDTNPNICPWAAVATDNALAGRPMTVPINQLPAQRAWTTPELKAILGGAGQEIPVNSVEDIVNSLPVGGRGIVWGKSPLDPNGIGHVFNVINEQGLVMFVDGTTGELINPYDYPLDLGFIRTN